MLDKQIINLLLHAEKCRKLRTGEVEHSPEVSEASEKMVFVEDDTKDLKREENKCY